MITLHLHYTLCLGLTVSASTDEDHQPPPSSNYGTNSPQWAVATLTRLLTFWVKKRCLVEGHRPTVVN